MPVPPSRWSSGALLAVGGGGGGAAAAVADAAGAGLPGAMSFLSGMPSPSLSDRLVSDFGTEMITSPESVTMGRVGMMGVPS